MCGVCWKDPTSASDSSPHESFPGQICGLGSAARCSARGETASRTPRSAASAGADPGDHQAGNPRRIRRPRSQVSPRARPTSRHLRPHHPPLAERRRCSASRTHQSPPQVGQGPAQSIGIPKGSGSPFFPLPSSFCLLPSAFFLLPSSFCLHSPRTGSRSGPGV
jgi:hypothetical protein